MTTSPDFLAAWRRLAVKHRVALGALAGSRADEFTAALVAASFALPADGSVAEREVNERLVGWLAGPGAMLSTDHVELRRWLVDLGLVERDGYGRAYRRAPPPPACRDAAAALAAVDPGAIATQARSDLARIRADRRARHEAREGNST